MLSGRRRPAKGTSRTLRKTAVSVGIIFFILVATGAGYTWYMDQKPAVQAPAAQTSEVEAAPNAMPKAVQPAANAKEGVAVELITSPVAAGDNATLSVHTNPTSICSISVVYGGVKSTDSGLKPRTADEYGTVSWTWTVDPNAPTGTWPIQVTCVYHGRSGVVQADLKVVPQSAATAEN